MLCDPPLPLFGPSVSGPPFVDRKILGDTPPDQINREKSAQSGPTEIF